MASASGALGLAALGLAALGLAALGLAALAMGQQDGRYATWLQAAAGLWALAFAAAVRWRTVCLHHNRALAASADAALAQLQSQQQAHSAAEQEARSAHQAEVTALRAELDALQADLEQRVSARTAELHTLNTALLADNAARRQAEASALDAQQEAEQASRTKDQFLANISHELRTPMNVIVGMTEMLWQTRLDDEQRRYVRAFRDAGDHLLGLLDDLLDLGRMNAGQLTLEVADVDLRLLCERVIDWMGPRAHRKRLELVLDLEPGAPRWVRADGHRLRQILVNLLGNAIKFTEQGEVVLQVRANGPDHLQILVIDTGPGIEPALQEAIFDRFRQADPSLTRRHGGSGLGLAICRHLVGLMHGSLTVRSKLGDGATFVLDLPLATVRTRASTTVVSESGVHKLLAELAGPVVLVDPSAAVRQSLRHQLQLSRLPVQEASGAAEARSTLDGLHQQARTPGIVLVSSRLLDGSALQVVQAVHSRWHGAVPVIVLRRDEDTDPLADWTQLGVVVTLRKPVLRSLLHDALLQALSGRAGPSLQRRPSLQLPARLPMLRLLLVDDADDNRMVVLAFCKHLPWRIDTASNGPDAIRMAAATRYDLILMDVQMPEMDGYTAVGHIRSQERANQRPPVAILAVTAHAAESTRVLSAEAGCQGWLTKPLKQHELIEAVLSAVSREPESATQLAQATVHIDPVLRPLIPGYLAKRKEDVARLCQALAAEDWEHIRVIGHSMKGSGGSYGLDRITVLGTALEDAAHARDESAAQRVIDDLEDFVANVRLAPT